MDLGLQLNPEQIATVEIILRVLGLGRCPSEVGRCPAVSPLAILISGLVPGSNPAAIAAFLASKGIEAGGDEWYNPECPLARVVVKFLSHQISPGGLLEIRLGDLRRRAGWREHGAWLEMRLAKFMAEVAIQPVQAQEAFPIDPPPEKRHHWPRNAEDWWRGFDFENQIEVPRDAESGKPEGISRLVRRLDCPLAFAGVRVEDGREVICRNRILREMPVELRTARTRQYTWLAINEKNPSDCLAKIKRDVQTVTDEPEG
jgi:hypothetical protein